MAGRRWIEANGKAVKRLEALLRAGDLGSDLRFLALRSAWGFSGQGVLDEFADDSLAILAKLFGSLGVRSCAHDGRGGPIAEARLELAGEDASGTLVISRMRALPDGLAIIGDRGQVFCDARNGRLSEFLPVAIKGHGTPVPADNASSEAGDWRQSARYAEMLRHPWEIEAPREFASLAGKRILVTGATGFIGARLVERLAEADAVPTAAIRTRAKTARIARLGIAIAQLDDTNMAEALSGHDAVVNLAHDFNAAPDGNSNLSFRIADACEAAGVPLLVQASSIAVYDGWPGAALDEQSPADGPGHSYKLLKRAIERDLENRERRGSLRSVILQPTIVYGAFSALWTDRFADRFRIGDVAIPDGSLCDGVHVDDLVDAVLAALANPAAKGRYIVSGPKPFAWRALLGAFGSACEGWGVLRTDPAVPPPAVNGATAPRQSGAVTRLRNSATQLAMASARRFLGDTGIARLRDALLKAAARGGTPIYRPARESPQLFANRAAVSTARMQQDLAKPRIEVEQGAQLTASYLAWRYCPFADCERLAEPE